MTSSWHDYSGPISVEGGLRARSARGAIGESWWSRRFLAILESFALGGRLTRGRNYARRGQVLSLEIAAGTVGATVQGSRPKPYDVRIGLAPFSDAVWAAVEAGLAEQALLSAQLLSGEVPAGLEEVCAAAGGKARPAAGAHPRASSPRAVLIFIERDPGGLPLLKWPA